MNKRSHYIILWVASALFVVSLFSPAIVTDFGAWQNPDGKPIPGHFCAQVYWPFYASNISILLAPLIFWLIQRFTTKPRYQRALAIFFMLSGVGAICLLPAFYSVHFGYFLWVASFVIAAVGAWHIPKPDALG
ncbi:MAG: hypothetical protein ACSHX4_02340 [Opitutaceae bacterium]